MKIIGGVFRGRRIEMPKGARMRPTSDKVRDALFNIVGERVKGALFLDLFAGSGAVGIEALSRGAGKSVFVDISGRCVKTIRKNVARLSLGSSSLAIIKGDALGAIKKLSDSNTRFNLIYLDPPYHTFGIKKCLICLCNHDILNPSCLVICEHFKKDPLPEEAGGLKRVKAAGYGDTVLSFYK